jgi:hypothetical protein
MFSLNYKLQVHQINVAYKPLLSLHLMIDHFLRNIDKDRQFIINLQYFLRCKDTSLSSRCCLPTIFIPSIQCLIISYTITEMGCNLLI